MKTRTVKMKYMQLFLMLILTGYTNIAFSQSTHTSDDNNEQLIASEDKLENISISAEEAFYIVTECKQFAIDDAIESDYVDDYVEVCAYELTQAVKTAKYRQQKQSTKKIPTSNSNSDKPKPL